MTDESRAAQIAELVADLTPEQKRVAEATGMTHIEYALWQAPPEPVRQADAEAIDDEARELGEVTG